MHIVRKLHWLPLILILTACATQSPAPTSNPIVSDNKSEAPKKEKKTYLDPAQIDTTRFLQPPPDEATSKREIEHMLTLQQNRTPEQAKRSVEDLEQSIFRFADVMGDKFKKDNLPKTAKLFETLYNTESALNKQGKEKWNRVRPPLADARIKPVAKYSSSGSYPSGHATFAYLSAIVLAEIVPEKREQIFQRAIEFGNNRVIGGVHYPSDIDAGRHLATMIAALIQQNPAYQSDYAEARSELRAVLGLK
ncbi:MAG TPA: phosphatase PAP2 family protein [Noviherbaspirillum sp.]|nr:phosphatase PAP2 family protein [Noviherbaspirillum sp.]